MISFVSPDEVGEVGASLSFSLDRPRTREELERVVTDSKRLFRDDPNFEAALVRETTVGGVTGLMRSEVRTYSPYSMHRRTALPPPVKLRSTEVFVTLDDRGYRIAFDAPVELYEKHRPTFEHLLETLRRSR